MNQSIYEKLNGSKKILVTGGAGFIGSAVIRTLLKETSAIIFNVDKLSYASDLTSINETLDDLGENGYKRYSFFKIDLYDEKSIREIVNEISPDIIMHLAAESHVDRSIEGPKIFLQSNIFGTFNLLNASLELYRSLPNKKKETFIFHHISTDEVYGSLGPKGFFDESTSYNPRSPYSASKASSDFLVNAWFHTYNLPVVITNCSNNYGPWQFPEKLIPVIICNALKGKKIPIYGNGLNIRDWLYVDDHVDALLHVICKGKIGSSYCIGGNNEKSNIDCAEEICFYLDKLKPKKFQYKKQIAFVKDRQGHDKRYAINASKIKTELGWEPKTNFSEGIRNTVCWYLENTNWLKIMNERIN